MKNKRLLALLLAALLLTTSCAGGTTSDTVDTTATVANTDVETETTYVMWQNLPKNDLGGYDF